MPKTLDAMLVPKNAAAVTKSDTTLLPDDNVGLYVGGAGDVVVDMAGGATDITFKAVPVGTTLRGEFKRVKAATTATLILVLY